jgi:hypothetical protein
MVNEGSKRCPGTRARGITTSPKAGRTIDGAAQTLRRGRERVKAAVTELIRGSISYPYLSRHAAQAVGAEEEVRAL